MTDKPEPMRAIDVTPVDHPKTSAEVFAFQLLTESWIDETGQHDQRRIGQFITARDALIRAEARDAALREAVAAIGDLDGPTETTDANIGIEIGLTRAVVEIQKLLTSPPPRVDGWIPVVEPGSPPPIEARNGPTLVWCADGAVVARTYEMRGRVYWTAPSVTHWMPLPAPPSPKDPSNG